jgi:alkanesulfonate monooxygenase SsuD/methylene tetrahydromethanopterin reductase-like flavin-dependent oxidoreductase (luciferase family)
MQRNRELQDRDAAESPQSLKVSLALWGIGPSWTYEATRAVVIEAERLGFDSVFHQDNLLGHHPMPRRAEILTPWVVLPALAQATSTIRLGTLATPALRRYAPLLAKDVATLDAISGGRVTVGLGAGDDVVQYRSIGQPFPERPERLHILRESIEAMRLLWTGESVSYDGEHIKLADALMSPRPVQEPYPPVWIAGNTSRRLTPELAGDVADGYCIMWGDDAVAERGLAAFANRWDSNGRPRGEMVAARVMHLLMGADGVDVDAEFTRLTGTPLDFSDYASEAAVPEDTDPAGFVRGHPDEMADRILGRTVAKGFNHVVLHLHAFGLEIDDGGLTGWAGNFLGAIRLFSERVWPELRRSTIRALPAPAPSGR